MQLLRLRGRKVCDRLLRQGHVWKGRHITFRYLDGHPRHPAAKLSATAIYVGTIASTKLDKSAVRRNRMRRRCREALRLILKDTESQDLPSTTIQLLLAPRSSSLDAPFTALTQDIRAFLSTRPHARSKEVR